MSKPWIVQLICCGRDDGTWPCATWEEADRLRNSYVDAVGHDRAAIIAIHLDAAETGGNPNPLTPERNTDVT